MTKLLVIKNTCLWAFVKHYMPLVATKSKKAIFSTKFKVKVIDLGIFWKDIISWVCMPNMKSLSPTLQKLQLKLELTTDKQTGQKQHTQDHSIRGQKNTVKFWLKLVYPSSDGRNLLHATGIFPKQDKTFYYPKLYLNQYHPFLTVAWWFCNFWVSGLKIKLLIGQQSTVDSVSVLKYNWVIKYSASGNSFLDLLHYIGKITSLFPA